MATQRTNTTNSFTKGLLMDFNPLATPNTVMTDALNATIYTYNGNESMLQQDMGNGRVETAFLPEGYIPVGTCEFGDIIYIVSYNPLENKSQIGCFPSPERNITSDEISEVEQSLTASEFQELNEGEPTGKIYTTSVKKIIYGNNSLNPGDKYIIYEEDSGSESNSGGNLASNGKTLSDYLNTSHKHDEWPKLLKLRVVSIEDSGKILDLDTSVKWYDNDYYIAYMNNPLGVNPDLDSYRSLVSSAYSIFQSRVSGKLAILAELEKIDSFSCTYDIFVKEIAIEDEGDGVSDGLKTKFKGESLRSQYTIFLYTSWGTTHNDVNPTGFVINNSSWEGVSTDNHVGGQLTVPMWEVTNDGNGVIKYRPSEATLSLPCEADLDNVFYYTLTYDLAKPSATFSDYINDESYNAKIDDIVNWGRYNKYGLHYYAALSDDYGRDMSNSYFIKYSLGQVCNATRLIDEMGMPLLTYLQDDEYEEEVDGNTYKVIPALNKTSKQYVYNLQRYSADTNGDVTYETRVSDGRYIKLKALEINDDVINNYFGNDIPTCITYTISETDDEATKNLIYEIKPYEIETNTLVFESSNEEEKNNLEKYKILENDLSALVWNFSVAPVMPYGILDYLAVECNIDFSKIGSGLIGLTEWRYYTSGEVLTLSWGLDVYSASNMGVAEVCMDFYDNQGLAASYHVSGKSSYSGSFTDTIYYGEEVVNTHFDNIDAYGHEYVHAGLVDEIDGTVALKDGYKPGVWESNKDGSKFINDAGKIYMNGLYLVRIVVKYCSKDIFGDYKTDNHSNWKTFYRWLWSNGIFNEQYYSIKDFNSLQPALEMDFSATFSTISDSKHVSPINSMESKRVLYYNANPYNTAHNLNETNLDDTIYQTLGASVYGINQEALYRTEIVTETNDNDEEEEVEVKYFIGNKDDYAGNVSFSVSPVIANAFNTFNLNDAYIKNLNVTVSLADGYITKSIDSPSLEYSGDKKVVGFEDSIQPIANDELLNYQELIFSGYEKNEDKQEQVEGDYYFDFAGHYDTNYGNGTASNVSRSLLNLLETEWYEANEDTAFGSEIYGSIDAYSRFKDSFSLNFALDNIGEVSYVDGSTSAPDGSMSSLNYYDSEGNLKSINKYIQYETNCWDLRSHIVSEGITYGNDKELVENGYVGKNAGGIKLTLTGIAFNKMYACELTEEIGAIKYLRSVLDNRYLANLSGLHVGDGELIDYESSYDKGIYYRCYKGHLLFNSMLTTGMGRSDKWYTYFGSITSNKGDGFISYPDNKLDANYTVLTETVKLTGKVEIPEYENDELDYTCESYQKYLRDKMQSNISAFMITKGFSHKGAESLDVSNDNKYMKGIRETFIEDSVSDDDKYIMYKDAEREDPGLGEIGDPPTGAYDDRRNLTYLHCFAVKDFADSNNVYPILDFFASDTDTSNRIAYQHCRYVDVGTKKEPNLIQKSSYGTLANMVGALYGQLYFVDEDAEDESAVNADNYVSLEAYTEYWNKDVLVDINTDWAKEVENGHTNSRDLLLIGYIDINTYVTNLFKNASVDTVSDKFESSDPLIQQTNLDVLLYGTQRAIVFQFGVPYEVTDLRKTYSFMQESQCNVYPFNATIDKENDGENAVRATGDPVDGLLYTYDENTGSVVQFGTNSVLYYIDQVYYFWVKPEYPNEPNPDDYEEGENDPDYLTDKATYDSEVEELDQKATRIRVKFKDEKIDSTQFSKLADILIFDKNIGLTWNGVSQLYNFSSYQKFKFKDHYMINIPGASIFGKYKPGT